MSKVLGLIGGYAAVALVAACSAPDLPKYEGPSAPAPSATVIPTASAVPTLPPLAPSTPYSSPAPTATTPPAPVSTIPAPVPTVSSTPAAGAYRYTGSNGLPDSGATSTSADDTRSASRPST